MAQKEINFDLIALRGNAGVYYVHTNRKTEMNALQAACPKCNPLYPELDEDGIPYTCYACCDTGIVDKAYADAYLRDLDDACEYRGMRPVVNGKHVVLCCDEYESWEERHPLLPASIFPKPIRSRANRAFEAAEAQPMYDFDDDLPF
jgi:hypothetical protein